MIPKIRNHLSDNIPQGAILSLKTLGVAFALILGVPLAHSAEIAINNGAFTAGTPEVPGWSQDGDPNDSGVADTGGRWSAELQYNSGAVYQTTAQLMTAGNVFDLTFNARIAGGSDQINRFRGGSAHQPGLLGEQRWFRRQRRGFRSGGHRPGNDLVEVSATVSPSSTPKLFVRFKVSQP